VRLAGVCFGRLRRGCQRDRRISLLCRDPYQKDTGAGGGAGGGAGFLGTEDRLGFMEAWGWRIPSHIWFHIESPHGDRVVDAVRINGEYQASFTAGTSGDYLRPDYPQQPPAAG